MIADKFEEDMFDKDKRFLVEENGETKVIPRADDKGDVTSDSGDEYVPYTYKGGDAHKPEKKEIDKDTETKEANETSVKKIIDAATEIVNEDERKGEGATKEETNVNKQDTAEKESKETDTDIGETAGAASGGLQKKRKGPKPAPRPPTRVSDGPRKAPIRYEDCEMNLMVQRPPDYRLHALDVFINSGVFKYVNPEVATKVINALMQ
ncbi:hypothetical protein DPMN_043846 [Dreissena polymorpha]|uniref:Uncharacterized protein n=1 Tax=Dreissena polymorpha TaxID=45954 RepID=A0A9D4D1C3_DREPO|nr:hypothetical protein DPMN_043846 [Dreissena polymorpha]